MLNRNNDNGNNNNSNRYTLVSSLRRLLNREISRNNVDTERISDNAREDESYLTRDVLQVIWSRMQTIPSDTRTVLLNRLSGESSSSRDIENRNRVDESNNINSETSSNNISRSIT